MLDTPIPANLPERLAVLEEIAGATKARSSR